MSQSPAWNLESEFPSIQSPEFQQDYQFAQKMIQQYPKPESKEISLSELIQAIHLERDAYTAILNMMFHCMNLEAIDTKDQEAKKWSKTLRDLYGDLNVAYMPYKLAIQNLSDSDFNQLVSDKNIEGEKFVLQHQRKLKDQILSPAEEVILEKMRAPGSDGWSDLYEKTCAEMKVEVEINGEKKILSLGQAQSMVRGTVEVEKKAAFVGMQKAWKQQESTPAQALNAMADWSYREMEMRSKNKKIHFLDHSLHSNRISSATVTTMMAEIQRVLPQLQKSLVGMAKILGKPKLEPWDMVCAGPESSGQIPFDKGFSYIKEGFSKVDAELGQFAELMLQNRWIEARDIESKGTGGYCMTYPKSRTPRIFQIYRGSYSDIFTVAHELGHAYHAWVMRDLPLRMVDYPSTLAETASTFGEFALFDHIKGELGENPQVHWLFLERLHGYLINVVARFHFEKEFYEQRQKGILSAQEISDLQVKVWKQWYGDGVTEIETHFWANKGHFYVPGPAFYNYPYTVGYLFSLSIYAQRERLGAKFWPTYKELLRDTGVMTCEDLVQKHLGYDLREPQFWRDGLESLIAKI
ncbi:MAG: M3 family metallopeptidase [Bdellovibrio sp.]